MTSDRGTDGDDERQGGRSTADVDEGQSQQNGGREQDRRGEQGEQSEQGQQGQQGQQGEQGQQDEQGQQSQQGREGKQGQQDQQNQSPSTAEKVLTGISIVFTVLLFGYVAWHAVQPPSDATPEAYIVETETLSNGSVLVRAKLTNPGDVGLISATVEASCGQPPPETTLSYVPAGGREQAVLICPPGTTVTGVSVSSWIPA